MSDWLALEEGIGYSFKNRSLLERALRHRSLGGASNERLEFLGDAILDFIIGEFLYHKYEQAREGELSRMRANLVNGQCLKRLATSLGLEKYLKFAPHDLRREDLPVKHSHLLADAMEAVIGAVYLDSGLERVRTLITSWYQPIFSEAAYNLKDPKTQLQEWLQDRKWALPIYQVVKETGKDNAKVFDVICEVERGRYLTRGEGTTKKKAEYQAAEAMFKLVTAL